MLPGVFLGRFLDGYPRGTRAGRLQLDVLGVLLVQRLSVHRGTLLVLQKQQVFPSRRRSQQRGGAGRRGRRHLRTAESGAVVRAGVHLQDRGLRFVPYAVGVVPATRTGLL